MGVPQNLHKAFTLYQSAADSGLAVAQYKLGEMYENGRGLPRKDKDMAFNWYMKSSSNNYPIAHTRMGLIFYKGFGKIKQDHFEAVKYFELAAKHPSPDVTGITQFAFCLEMGVGVAKDLKSAIYYYDIAVKKLRSSRAMVNRF